MKRPHLIIYIYNIALAACMLLGLASCSPDIGDDAQQPRRGKVTLRLTSAYNDGLQTTQTRASNFQDIYAVDGEMFFEAYVVMVNSADQKVAAIIRVFPTGGKVESEREAVAEVSDLQEGEYDFYSFANMKFSTIPEEITETNKYDVQSLTVNNRTFTVGQEIPANLEEVTYSTNFNNFDLEAHTADTAQVKGIAMSNVQKNQTVSLNGTNVLQLYRMASKVRFLFRNNTANDVTIKKIQIDGITSNYKYAKVIEDNPPEIQSVRGDSLVHRIKDNDGSTLRPVTKDHDIILKDQPSEIFFLPPRNKEGNDEVDFPQNHITEPLIVYDNETGQAISKDATNFISPLPDCYFNESQVEHATGQTLLTVTAERVVDGEKREDDVRLALMRHRDYYRNSIVLVPITLTDYVVDLEAFFYPPIGGYPPYKLEKMEREFYATFEGAGDFILIPHVYQLIDKDKPENWYQLNDKSHIESYSITKSGDLNIFSKEPEFDATTGELLGTLNGNKGTAAVQLDVNIIVDATAGVVQHYTRMIYIIAK